MLLAIYKRRPVKNNFNKLQQGFSLIELVVGIVVMAIALTFLSSLFFTNSQRSVEPLLQIRAVEFSQALMDEILSKNFDELTPVGGVPACTACSGALGPEGESRDNYNDVDDYNYYCSPGVGVVVKNASDDTPDNFENFLMSVCVIYDGNYDGVEDTDSNAKLITVDIFPPAGAGLGNPITLTVYRGNF